MPELPEVDTIKKQLRKILPFKISKYTVSVGLKKNILHTKLNLEGKTIIDVDRKGKLLIFTLDDNTKLLSHLGMTGTWLINKNLKQSSSQSQLTLKHIHLQLISPQGFSLSYYDPRRFGHLYQLNFKSAQEKINALGLDLADENFNIEYLKKSLTLYPERDLKVTLLDQKLFAGSGNYIANEICARAKILPTRKCKDLKTKDFPMILQAIKDVIYPALISGGTTFQGGYIDTTGEKGQGVSNLVVFYQKICKMCNDTPVEKIMQAQRGTYFCPRCQK